LPFSPQIYVFPAKFAKNQHFLTVFLRKIANFRENFCLFPPLSPPWPKFCSPPWRPIRAPPPGRPNLDPPLPVGSVMTYDVRMTNKGKIWENMQKKPGKKLVILQIDESLTISQAFFLFLCSIAMTFLLSNHFAKTFIK
jgi:hypothetical protein